MKLDLHDMAIKIHSIQVDQAGGCVPLVILDSIRPITADHLEYSIKWSVVGERLAKIVLKMIKDELE